MSGNNIIGSAARNKAMRTKENPDPYHTGRFRPFESVEGVGGLNVSGPYDAVLDWPEPAHPGSEWKTGSCRGMYAESPDRIIAVYAGEVPAYDEKGVFGSTIFRNLSFCDTSKGRHCHEIVVYNRAGEIIEVWDQWMDALHEQDRLDGREPNLGHVNRIRVNRYDPEGHVWIVGSRNTGVFKFTRDGKSLALKINADNVPVEYHPLVYAQDVAFLPTGETLVGMWNCVMKFDEDGKFIACYGEPGSGPVQYDGLHGLEVHPETHELYISDRFNARIQIIDQNGKFLRNWPGFQGVMTIRISADGEFLWTGNCFVHKFAKYTMDGRLVPESTWGTFGIAPGTIWAPHYFETDSENNFYVGEDYSGRMQKFVPREGAGPDDPQWVGPLAR